MCCDTGARWLRLSVCNDIIRNLRCDLVGKAVVLLWNVEYIRDEGRTVMMKGGCQTSVKEMGKRRNVNRVHGRNATYLFIGSRKR
jgi:hypothetical protein